MNKKYKENSGKLSNAIISAMLMVKILIDNLDEKPKQNPVNEFLALITYIGVSLNDLQLLHKHYIISNDNYEINLFSRLIAMSIKEFLDDIFGFLSRAKNETQKYNANNDIQLEFNNIKKELNILKSRHYAELKEIRNNAVAHKDKNPKVLISYFFDKNKTDISNINIEIIDTLINIINTLTSYVYKSLKELD
jgi:hypothetical protein